MCSKRISRALVAALAVSACGAWERIADLSPDDTLPQRQQVQVWSAGKARVWHAVRFDADSVSGVPFHLSPSCDSCRVAIARAAVDSVRLGDPERIGMTFAGLVILAILAIGAALSQLGEGT